MRLHLIQRLVLYLCLRLDKVQVEILIQIYFIDPKRKLELHTVIMGFSLDLENPPFAKPPSLLPEHLPPTHPSRVRSLTWVLLAHCVCQPSWKFFKKVLSPKSIQMLDSPENKCTVAPNVNKTSKCTDVYS